MREALSTARPTPLRLLGFLTLAAGAAAAGLGAVRDWAVVGFPQDEAGAADVSFRGTDVWEGKTVLLVAVGALVLMLTIRLVQATPTRKTLAILVIALGIGVVALTVTDAVRATDRFGGRGGLDRIAAALASELELPEDVVLGRLEEQLGADLRVEVRPGLWVSALGGALIAVGGALSLAWASRGRAGEPSD